MEKPGKIKLSNKDRIYVGSLRSVCDKMEELLESNDFDMKKAVKLNQKYCLLAGKTYADDSRSEEDLDSWCLAFSQAYDPIHTRLSLRVLSEMKSQKEEIDYII